MPLPARLKLSPEFIDAFSFAAQLHADQMRKGLAGDDRARAVPYIAHLMGVASLVLEHGGGEREAIAALLHDAIEDQTQSHGGDPAEMRERISRRFGKQVLRIVEGCSDSEGVNKAPWRQRKEAYLARLAAEPRDVQLVSLADKVHNARSLVTDLRRHGAGAWLKFNAPREEQVWLLRALVAVFRSSEAPPELVEEFARLAAEIETFGFETGKPTN